MKYNSFKPVKVYKTIYDIDYESLYNDGKRYIIFDLDNTIIPYSIATPQKDSIDLVNHLKEIGFTCLILSNNHNERLYRASRTLNIDYIANAMKPFKKGYKRIFKKYENDPKLYFAIGDQLITDVKGASRCKIDCILVKPIDRSSEHWYTKINRGMESFVLKRIKKSDFELYQEIMNIRG